MKSETTLLSRAAAFVAVAALGAPAWAATGIQVGATGNTYASSGLQCALHPVTGMSPVVQAGLYNPKRNASATVSLNGAAVATVTFFNPDTNVWLVNGANTVVVALNKRSADSYKFDAASNQPNICIPDTSGNTSSGDFETAASAKSYATVTPGCALNPLTALAQPYIHLFDNGAYLLNVSVNNVPLTQLSQYHAHTPVFLSAGLNVISAANAAASIDYYVRDGGNGSCTLP
ncbi:MAG: hypothetical protein EHM59_02770 [Betaproteobacteria bacterium]|nr:MAG: hypothetical protein EHM59_02770 [Betaproteobacteria bacterium]